MNSPRSQYNTKSVGVKWCCLDNTEKRPLGSLGLLMITTIQDIYIIVIVSLPKGKVLSTAPCPDSSRADCVLYNLHFQFSTAISTSYLDGSFHTLEQILLSVLKTDHQWCLSHKTVDFTRLMSEKCIHSLAEMALW